MNFLNMVLDGMGNRLHEKLSGQDGGAMGNIMNAIHGQPMQGGGVLSGAQGFAQPAQQAPVVPGPGQVGWTPDPEVAGATPQQDAMAKRAGFRSADEMAAWQRNREVNTGNNPTQGAAGSVPHTVGQARQAVSTSMLYPPNALNYVLQAFRGATGGH